MAKKKFEGKDPKECGANGDSRANKQNNRRTNKSNRGGRGQNSRPDSIAAQPAGYGGNDFTWYNKYPAQIQATGNLPFNQYPGKQVTLGNYTLQNGDQTLVLPNFSYQYPGLMTLGFYPSVGLATDLRDPINVVAQELYANIRKNYSGSLEVDPQDIVMYILAVDSCNMFIEDMKRAYYLINNYNSNNYYFPRGMLGALGYDYNDLHANEMDFFKFIDDCQHQMSRYCVPDIMDLFKRHTFMCANVYADEPVPKAQIYAFKLLGVYQLTNTTKMTELTMYDLQMDQFSKLSDLKAYWADIYGALANWDDSHTINGYLMRTYESSGWLVSSPVTFGGLLDPVYNAEVLMQIQNASAVNVDPASLAITQNGAKTGLISEPEMKPTSYALNGKSMLPNRCVLNIPISEQPDASLITVASRLATVGRMLTNGHHEIRCGTEIVAKIEVYTDTDGIPWDVPSSTAVYFPAGTNAEQVRKLMRLATILDSFNQHPIFQFAICNRGDHPDSVDNFLLADVSNLTSTDFESMAELHRTCILSEFNCYSILQN